MKARFASVASDMNCECKRKQNKRLLTKKPQQKQHFDLCHPPFLDCLHFVARPAKCSRAANPTDGVLPWLLETGSGDESSGSGGELCDQAGAGGGPAAVQRGQREPGESSGHHQGAAAAAGA